jgi:hypothetical protein
MLELFIDVPEAHRLTLIGDVVGQNARTEGDLLVEITLGEAIVREFEL